MIGSDLCANIKRATGALTSAPMASCATSKLATAEDHLAA
jgi:hypothetical protein